VLELLPTVLGGRVPAEIFERLEQWRLRKEQARSCCEDLGGDAACDCGTEP